MNIFGGKTERPAVKPLDHDWDASPPWPRARTVTATRNDGYDPLGPLDEALKQIRETAKPAEDKEMSSLPAPRVIQNQPTDDEGMTIKFTGRRLTVHASVATAEDALTALTPFLPAKEPPEQTAELLFPPRKPRSEPKPQDGRPAQEPA